MATPNVQSGPDRARAKRRWWRVRGRVLLVMGLLLVGLYWLATDSFLTRRVLVGAIADATGAHVSASSVTVTPAGRVLVSNLSLRAPGVSGDAGEVFRVRELRAHTNLWQYLRGNTIIHSLSLDQPVARVSRSFPEGQVNIAPLVAHARGARPVGTTTSRIGQVPTIAVSNGILELGEHTIEATGQAPKYAILKQLYLSGTVDQSADDTGASIISFRQASPDAQASTGAGLLALGRISQESVSLTVTGLDLSELTPANVPTQARGLMAEAAIEGRVSQAEFAYEFAGAWTARVLLDDVGITLPLEAQPDEDGDGNPIPVPASERDARLRLERTDGEIVLSDVGVRGQLNGQLEALPYEVRFAMQGTSVSAPWTLSLSARDVKVHEQPEILKFAPGTVRRRLREFSDPEGRVDATVDIARGSVLEGADAPPLRVVGSIELKGLTAAFHKFPYPWKNLRGTITFDDSRINFHNIRGQGAGGSTVVADGFVMPPNDEAEVRVNVRALGIPIDDAVRDAMRARGQDRVLDELFSEQDYARLVERRLVRPGAARQDGEQEGEAQAADASVPAFDLGGVVDVDVKVHRLPGPGSNWKDRVDITIKDAGVLLRAFPYPLRASSVTIVQENGVATIAPTTVLGLRGGQGEVRAVLDLASLEVSDDFVPLVSAKAMDIPIDALLLAALPTINKDDPERARPLSDVVTPLGARGSVRANVELGNTALGASYDIRATLAGELWPPGPGGESTRMVVEDFGANVHVTEAFVKLDALGVARGRSAGDGGGRGAGRGSVVSAHLFRKIGDLGLLVPTTELLPTEQSLHVQAPRIDLGLPIEDVVRGYSLGGARAIERAREQVAMEGQVHADVRVAMGDERVGNVDLTLTRFRNARVGVMGQRLELDQSQAQTARVRSDATGVEARYVLSGTLDDQPFARVRVEGTFEQEASPEGQASPPARQAIDLRARDVALGVPSLLGTIEKAGMRKLVEFVRAWEVDSILDADLLIEMGAAPASAPAHIAAEDEPPARVRGTLRPRSLAFNASTASGVARRVEFPQVVGQVRLGPAHPEGASSPDARGSSASTNAGQVESLSLLARDWKTSVAGSWAGAKASLGSPDETGATRIESRFTISAPILTSDLRAILPDALETSMDQMSMRLDGPIALAQVPLGFTILPDGNIANVLTTGSLSLAGLSLNLGVPVTQAEGVVDFRYSSEAVPGSGRASLSADMPSLRASNVQLSLASLKLFTEPDGRVIVPRFEAKAHGGRIAGSLQISAPATASPSSQASLPSPRQFDLALDLSSVRFAPLLEELRARRAEIGGAAAGAGIFEGVAGGRAQDDGERPSEASMFVPTPLVPDESRGVLSGSFSLRSAIGDTRKRRGRGTFTIEGGNILDLPTLVPLVRVTNLQLPVNEELDQARADFFVLDERVGLEQLAISSSSVSLFGYGTATWPDLQLDVRLRTANRSRIPLLTEVIEQLRDELSAVRVRGAIDKPEITTQRFGATREALAHLFGEARTDDERRLDTIERALSSSERRERADTLAPIEPNEP